MHSGLFPLLGCLLAASEHLGIGGLLHVARVNRENVENHIYMAQRILEHINAQLSQYNKSWLDLT